MSKHVPFRSVYLCLIAALLSAGAARSHALDLQAAIDPLARQLVDDKVVVGLVVGVYKDGETQVLSYGETRKGGGIAPDGDTVYEVGSISKAFTGVLLADLVERDRVKLDDPLHTYLSPAATTSLKNVSHITFEHLVTHTSGLPRLPDNLKPADPQNPYADYTLRQVFDFLKDHQPRRKPGKYEYSNYGMGLLGVLLASREGMSYEELLSERIAKPCGMKDTSVVLSDAQRRRLAPPYDASLEAAKNWDIPALAGAGGIRSTANDMLRFIAANLAQDDAPFTKACRLSHEVRHKSPEEPEIALAWHMAGDGITRWHNGMTGGYAGWLAVVPDYQLGIVVLSNTAADEITAVGAEITRVAFVKTLERPASPTVVEVAPEVLKQYVGTYAITPQFALTVTLEGDGLQVQATGQQKFPVYPESQTRFFYKAVDAQLTFQGVKNGKAERLILHQNGIDQTASRRQTSK